MLVHKGTSVSYTHLWSEIIAPTCTEQGYTYYHCNEDSSKDYKSCLLYTSIIADSSYPSVQAC